MRDVKRIAVQLKLLCCVHNLVDPTRQLLYILLHVCSSMNNISALQPTTKSSELLFEKCHLIDCNTISLLIYSRKIQYVFVWVFNKEMRDDKLDREMIASQYILDNNINGFIQL